jgi:hypothetical protein
VRSLSLRALVQTALILAAGPTCTPCPRSGCDAFGSPASASVRQGIAGAVAHLSDVVNDGCEECPLSQTQLRLWKTDTRVADATAARAAAAAAPTTVIDADRRYQAELQPGEYLLCAAPRGGTLQPPCAAFAVASGTVTTINVKTRYGQTGLMVFDHGASAARSPEIFDFSPAPN